MLNRRQGFVSGRQVQVMDMPVLDPVFPSRKSLHEIRTVFGLLQSDDQIRVNQIAFVQLNWGPDWQSDLIMMRRQPGKSLR
jgi:hypothetical protein